jgi:hypothetical protein
VRRCWKIHYWLNTIQYQPTQATNSACIFHQKICSSLTVGIDFHKFVQLSNEEQLDEAHDCIVSCLLNSNREVVGDKSRSFEHKYSPFCKKENYHMWILKLWRGEPPLPIWARPTTIRCASSQMARWSLTQNQSHMYPPRFLIKGPTYVNAFFME